ncbi:MAG: hypothetical protein Q9169_005435 [Polycauliona sp. 2 TL-2023]
MPRYQYTALDPEAHTTRLLTLLPGSVDDEIHVSLRIISLAEKPEYEALSYAWGSTENPVRISVDVPRYMVSVPGGHLDVTQNLAVALRYLRSETTTRDLWIDAICVDQQNLEERGYQVQRMADIYRQAERVRIWLGPESQDSALAIEALSSLASQIEVDWHLNTFRPSNTSTDDEVRPDWQADTSFSEDTWISIAGLLGRPWFRRLWVWQEALLAKTAEMQCGLEIISWNQHRKAIMALYGAARPDLPEHAGTSFEESYHLSYNLVAEAAFEASFTVLIQRTRDCICSDPRDKIYALLSILHPSDPIVGLIPDYTKAPDVVFRDVVLRRFHGTGDLHMLASCELRNTDSVEGKHSWIHDWSSPRTTDHIRNGKASWGSRARAQTLDSGCLQVTGCLVAEISHIEDEIVDTLPRVQDLTRRLLKRVPFYRPHATDSEILDALCRTICMNEFSDAFVPPDDDLPDFEESLCHLLYETSAASKNSGLFVHQMWHSNCGRRVLITNEGSIGLGPKTAEPGDQIYVILGCRSPLVIRQARSGNYIIVGECYIHGIMEGETLLGPLPDEWQSVNIYNEGIGYMHAFLDRQTGEQRYDDPRLGPLPSGWRLDDPDRKPDWNNWFINEETGERPDWPRDPRMTPEALEARGVTLQEIVFE